jgi:predicted DsbA family dithiol-disulfide isomerase
MRQVAKKRPVEVAWKLLSLAEINKSQEQDERHQIAHSKGFRMERLLLAARRHGGNAAIERLYMTLGEAHHGRKEDLDDDKVIAACLQQAGLPDSLYKDALADASTESDLLAEHNDVVERLHAFGVPTLVLEGSDVAIFGPIVEPIPQGEAGLDLWDHMLWNLQQPYLWELKRERMVKLTPQHVIE